MFTAYDKTIGRVVDAEDAKANGGKSHVFSGWFIDIMKSVYNIKASEDDGPGKKKNN